MINSAADISFSGLKKECAKTSNSIARARSGSRRSSSNVAALLVSYAAYVLAVVGQERQRSRTVHRPQVT